MGEWPSRRHQFGAIDGNPQCTNGGRRGVVYGKARRRELRVIHAMAEAMRGPKVSSTFAGSALDYLRSVYVDEAAPAELRLACARWALPFESPALAASVVSTSINTGLADRLSVAIARAASVDPLADRVVSPMVDGDE